MRDLTPPFNAPLIFYHKEWMRISDFISLAGMNTERKVLSSFDFVFLNRSLLGYETLMLCTGVRYSDSIWIKDFRTIPYDEAMYEVGGLDLKHGKFRGLLRTLNLPVPSYAYYLGSIQDYDVLTYRILKVIYQHSHRFKTISSYAF